MSCLNGYLNSKYDLDLPSEDFDKEYNCMAFAFNYTYWINLNDFMGWDDIVWDGDPCDLDEEGMNEYECRREEDVDNCIAEVLRISEMLDDFKDYSIRVIHSVKELRKGEYAVGMKLGYDDFHFVRRFNDGKWYQKIGCHEIREIEEREVFSKVWYNPYCETFYDTDTVLFAVIAA